MSSEIPEVEPRPTERSGNPHLINQLSASCLLRNRVHVKATGAGRSIGEKPGRTTMYFTRACFYAAVCAYLMPVSVLVAGLNYANAKAR
jgi:hypothetical protein